MIDSYIRQSHGFLILYDITKKNSFEEVENYFEKVFRIKDEEKFPMVLIGSKCDLEKEREISFEEGFELAKKYGIPFFETSAKVCINIEESIFALIEEIYKSKQRIPSIQHQKKDCLIM
jgi:GTPase KRas